MGIVFRPYSYNNFKWKGHTSFINDMNFIEIKRICDDIYNEVESHIWSNVMKLNDEGADEVFRNAVVSHGLSSMSVRINMGMIEVTQPDQEQIYLWRLDNMKFPEFAQIYHKISTGCQSPIDLDTTLSEACPQYFYWRGL